MSDLPAEIIDWIGKAVDGQVTKVGPAASGGRTGYLIDVEIKGELNLLFLQRGRKPGDGSFMPLAQESEVFKALEKIGVAVPHIWGVSEEANVVLMDRLDGMVWFQEPRDPDERLSIAQDFIRQLARWHSTPANDLDIPSFKPVLSAKEHQQDQLKGIRHLFEEADAVRPIDKIAIETLNYLENNIPDYDGPAVLCQGDTGPGNFLYKDGLVQGVIDWELAHIGDPMDDIAWLSWRSTQHGFPEFPERMKEYAELSGIEVDPARVHYYRVNACARLGPLFGLADMGQMAAMRAQAEANGQQQDNDRSADGSQMIMSMLHRRMRLEALGKALGMDLPGRIITDEAEPHEHAGMYDNVLRQLQTMVPMIDDFKAASLAKGVARQVKYLKEVDRNYALFAAHELAEMSHLLGQKVQSLEEGRPLLAEAARTDKISFEGYFLYHWNRMIRDDHMMREASGRIFQRAWPELI